MPGFCKAATLDDIRKRQNTKRSLSASIRKLYDYGMFVNTGYIIGFDSERGGVAPAILELIEASAVPVNMVGLLFALPRTELSRRLEAEGRLLPEFAVAPDDVGDQCTAGCNFITRRPRGDILRDYRRVIAESYRPDAYFARVGTVGRLLNCSRKRLRLPWRYVRRDVIGLGRLLWRMGVRRPYRARFWRLLLACAWRNPRALRYVIALAALYLHFGPFTAKIVARLDREIERADAAPQEEAMRMAAAAAD